MVHKLNPAFARSKSFPDSDAISQKKNPTSDSEPKPISKLHSSSALELNQLQSSDLSELEMNKIFLQELANKINIIIENSKVVPYVPTNRNSPEHRFVLSNALSQGNASTKHQKKLTNSPQSVSDSTSPTPPNGFRLFSGRPLPGISAKTKKTVYGLRDQTNAPVSISLK